MHLVESSSVDAIGYDRETRALYVKFLHSGQTYVYWGVEEAVFHELMNSPSKGSFVNSVIKQGYDYGLA